MGRTDGRGVTINAASQGGARNKCNDKLHDIRATTCKLMDCEDCIVTTKRLKKFAGHILRLVDERPANRAMNWVLEGGKRGKRRLIEDMANNTQRRPQNNETKCRGARRVLVTSDRPR